MKRSIATKTGDEGSTSLMFGKRVLKDDIRVDTYGSVDELTSMLGLARSHSNQEFINELILHIQKESFIVCAELATPVDRLGDLKRRVDESMVAWLDENLQEIEQHHTYSMDWSVPGDHPAAAALDVARTICRRAERQVIALYRAFPESKNLSLVKYLNRLSDLLWLMARWQEKEHNVKLTSVRDFLDADK